MSTRYIEIVNGTSDPRYPQHREGALAAGIFVDSSAASKLKYSKVGVDTEIIDATSSQTLAGKIFPSVSGQGAGPIALTPAQSGSTFLFDRAAGIIYTLPAPQVGLWYDFVVTVAVTSNAHKIVANTTGTDLLIGSIWETIAAGTGTQFFPNGSSNSAISMNGSTTGGLINTFLSIVCVSATQWLIDGTVMASGTIATPFANS